MNIHEEFVTRVNDAIKNRKRGNVGREFRVILPVPEEFLIDCGDVSGIDLDNATISFFDGTEIRDEQGNILLDEETMKRMGQLYMVRGIIKE